MLPTMVDKTDVSELVPETVDPNQVTRTRFATLRDQLLTAAEAWTPSANIAQMVDVAHLVSAAAQADHVISSAERLNQVASLEELERQKQAEVNEYFQQFIGMLKTMEGSNDQRFAQQREWVERELKARGMEPPKNAKVLSLVPETPPPDPAG